MCGGRSIRYWGALLAAEDRFDNRLVAPAEAVAAAIRIGRPGHPVVLADVQDNPGCGATSDTTTLIRALIDAGAQRAAVSALWDREAASAAHAAGIGAEITLALGGRYGYGAGPLHARFRVEALSGGELTGHGAILAGGALSLGPMARLKVLDTPADVQIVVCSVRYQCLDQVLFRGLGIEPAEQAILVVKSTVHFRADFDPIAAETILVEAPGGHPCRCAAVAYRKLRPGVRLTVGDQ